MSRPPIQITADEAAHELVDLNQKLLKSIETLGRIRDDDVDVGVTPKDAVYREGTMVLYRYRARVAHPLPRPLLITYALVNRPYMVDLQEDRSMVRKLLDLGLDVYLIDWGYPRRADRWLTLDDYINGMQDTCVDVVRERSGQDQINLMGICQGGAFSLCYAAIHPEKVRNLVAMVAPVDFHVKDGLLNLWAQGMDIDLMVDALGNIPGEFMNLGFLMLRPFQLNIRKYLDMVDLVDDDRQLLNFLRMEKWIFDSPDQAGEAYRQFMKDFYQGNKLIKGDVVIGDQRVELLNIRMPVLNLYAEQDNLVPPSSSIALKQFVGTKDYTARGFPVGHIGMYVSSKAQRDLAPAIVDWLKARP